MKRKLSNILMVIAILVIIFSGVMLVFSIKGENHKNGQDELYVSEISGNVTIERSDISYSLTKNTVMKKGDILETLTGSTLRIESEQTAIILNENTEVEVKSCDEHETQLKVNSGEIFVNNKKLTSEETYQVVFQDKTVSLKDSDTTFSVSIQDGSENINVLAGSLDVLADKNSENVAEGESLTILESESDGADFIIAPLTLESLDDFVLEQAWRMSANTKLSFSGDEIKAVIDARTEEKKEAKEALLSSENEENVVKDEDAKTSDNPVASKEDTDEEEASSKNEDGTESNSGVTGENSDSSDNGSSQNQEKSGDSSSSSTSKKNDSNTGSSNSTGSSDSKTSGESSDKTADTDKNTSSKEDTSTSDDSSSSSATDSSNKATYTCSLSIQCDTILDHMKDLKSGKSAYVPSDGCILSATKVEFTEGDTVYDVLKRACDVLGIQMEASYTPIYKSYYVEGIHNLYEFDCGTQSGWMYKVNGWYPNYGCSAYKVKDGDTIVWNYTCEGLGEDIS